MRRWSLTSPDLGFLDDMLSAARAALRFVGGMSESDFAADEKTFDAVVRKLEIIGEAAGRVTSKTRERLALPWQQMIAQRHIAIHHYRKLDPQRIWVTVRDDLPRAVEALEAFLKDKP